MFDVVTAGHLTIDSILVPGKSEPSISLGGSAAYASIASRRLGAASSIISKIGADFPREYLRRLEAEGIDLSGLAETNGHSTCFELKYNDDMSERWMKLRSVAPPITPGDLPGSLKAKAIHIAPVAGELTYDAVDKMRDLSSWLSLDPQGLIRTTDKQGNITHLLPEDNHMLELIDIYKSSLEEIKCVTGVACLDSAIRHIHDLGVRIIIVTLGVKGALLSLSGLVHRIPAFNPERFVDPTGAGDIFIGSFLAEFTRGEDLVWCGCVGSAASSTIVESIGLTRLGSKSEIYRRAGLLRGKEIKQYRLT